MMGSVFSPPKPAPIVQAPPPPLPEPDDPAVDDRRKKERLALRRRRGRRSFIGGLGAVGDTSPAPVNRPTLLGQAGTGG